MIDDLLLSGVAAVAIVSILTNASPVWSPASERHFDNLLNATPADESVARAKMEHVLAEFRVERKPPVRCDGRTEGQVYVLTRNGAVVGTEWCDGYRWITEPTKGARWRWEQKR